MSKHASIGRRGTASSVTGAVRAGAVSGRTLKHRAIRKRQRVKFCGLIRNAPPYEDSPEFSACRATRSQKSDHNILPAGHHQARYPKRGPTNHMERFNNALRQRRGRFIRKTLSFSKSLQMHESVIQLFLHQYNLTRPP